MKRHLGRFCVLMIWGVGLAVAVVGYHLYAYSCAGCRTGLFFIPGVPEDVFLGLTAAAALILIVLKWRRKSALAKRRCDCGIVVDPNWDYCPLCGLDRQGAKG